MEKFMQLVTPVLICEAYWPKVSLKVMIFNVLGMGSKFDVRAVQVTKPPATIPEPIYEVKIDDQDILIRKQN